MRKCAKGDSSLRSFALALTLAIALPGIAHADDEKAARQAYLDGRRLFDLGEFKPALEAFKRAYLNYEAPAFLYNIAQCHRELGEYKEAIRFYRTYLQLSPNADDRVAVETLIAELDERLRSSAPVRATEPPRTGPTAASEPVAQAPPAPVESKPVPLVRKWWFWTAVGGGAALVLAIGLGVGLSASGSHFSGTVADWKVAAALTVHF
jgi:tetratricopeptide (TPR) repeat protein